ncbi:hypothetical protein EYF80_006459 [Liparis tanakae]|uniref:Uncharacterized protein n=1 Tax=Liparis tanakae TaxID=230148 RepID=A0A4Z2J1C8_9TELE|nr:hypothetical protein EYF80_006459 [Liparis tanakae]
MAGSPRRGATGLWVGRWVRVGVAYRVWLGWREGMGVVWLWLGRRWQWVVGQRMGVGVATLHGALLISRWFMVGFIVLAVEAAILFHGATSPTCVSPARRGVMTLAGCAVVGYRGSSGRRTLSLGRLRGKVAGGWGSALWSPRLSGHGLTDYRGVGRPQGVPQGSSCRPSGTSPEREP